MKTAREIGALFRRRRQELGLTQLQIYEKTGISTGNLSSIETGRCNASLDAFLRLVTVLDIPCTEIFNIKEFNSPTTDETTLIEVYRTLPPQYQAELQNFANYLSEKNSKKTTLSSSGKEVHRAEKYTG